MATAPFRSNGQWMMGFLRARALALLAIRFSALYMQTFGQLLFRIARHWIEMHFDWFELKPLNTDWMMTFHLDAIYMQNSFSQGSATIAVIDGKWQRISFDVFWHFSHDKWTQLMQMISFSSVCFKTIPQRFPSTWIDPWEGDQKWFKTPK